MPARAHGGDHFTERNLELREVQGLPQLTQPCRHLVLFWFGSCLKFRIFCFGGFLGGLALPPYLFMSCYSISPQKCRLHKDRKHYQLFVKYLPLYCQHL